MWTDIANTKIHSYDIDIVEAHYYVVVGELQK